MGCCAARLPLSAEDRVISFCERKIGLSNCSPLNIELTIRKWVGSEGLTLARFRRAAESLKINIGDFSSPEDTLVVLFKQFKTGDSFNVAEIIQFCVYLCNARPNEKASVWFDIIDSTLQYRLTYGQIKEFVSLIYKFTFKVLPLLAQGEGEMAISVQSVEIYTNEAIKYQKDFVEAYSMKLCPDHTIDKQDFVCQISLYSKISYSDGVRQLLREFIKQ